MKKAINPEILAQIMTRVLKPARYSGGEWNEIKKDPAAAKIKIALAFPDTYEVGMSSIGLRILYYLINSQPDILAERVFAPWPDFEQQLRKNKLPLFSLENKLPLFQFDIIGFSLLYELNFTNVLTMLDLGGIKLFSEEREDRDPLIIAGGPSCFNPEPIVDFIDAFFIGDGEEAIFEIIDTFKRSKERGESRQSLLSALAQIKGMYVPRFYRIKHQSVFPLLYVEPENGFPSKIEKRVVFNLSQAPYPDNPIVPSTEIVFDRVQVEVARGCPQRCRFCQATSLYFPHRFRSPEAVKKMALNNLASTGYDEIALTALSASDYPHLTPLVKEIMDALTPRKIALSFPSLRPGGVSEEIVDSIVEVRKTGLTIVPEAGTERLRRVINKHLSDEEIWEASRAAFSRGWRLLKLYFMVGLPTETDEDLEGIIRIVEEILKIGVTILKVAPQINLSLSSFIPKPHTPFQWEAMESREKLQQRISYLKSRLKKYSTVRFKDHPVLNSLLEAIISRGDRRLGAVIRAAWEKGARFDSWSDTFDFRLWEKAFEEEGLDYQIYLKKIFLGAKLPWDHINTGLKKKALIQELRRAYRAERTPSCSERECRFCLGCDFSHVVNKLLREEKRVQGDIKKKDVRKIDLTANEVKKRERNVFDKEKSDGPDRAQIRESEEAKREDEGKAEEERRFNLIVIGGRKHERGEGESKESKGRKGRKERKGRWDKEKEGPRERRRVKEKGSRDAKTKEDKEDKERSRAVKRYRFYFEKKGPARFISHLDLINTIPRILRRAQIQAEFSQGFHPKMKLTFLPALPLGMASREEIFELRVKGNLEEKKAVDQLNKVSPEGIVFKDVKKVDPHRSSLNREVKAVLYSLEAEPLRCHLNQVKIAQILEAEELEALQETGEVEEARAMEGKSGVHRGEINNENYKGKAEAERQDEAQESEKGREIKKEVEKEKGRKEEEKEDKYKEEYKDIDEHIGKDKDKDEDEGELGQREENTGELNKRELEMIEVVNLIRNKKDRYQKRIDYSPQEDKIYFLYRVEKGDIGNPYRLLQQLFDWDEAAFYLTREKVFLGSGHSK